jgi:predicted ATPase
MLRTLHLRGYRSLRDFRLSLGRITVVTGGNGVGKSNLYRALAMLQRMADGRFAEAVAQEGGMPSLLWAGERRKEELKRITWELSHADFDFSMECGLSPADRNPVEPSKFQTDPDIKSESIRFGGAKGRLMAKRRGPVIDLRNPEGKMEASPLPVHAPESMLSEIRDGLNFPALTAVRETLLGWRFYHQFRTDPDSPLRRPRIGSWSPVLAHDGSNLAAALQSIGESGWRIQLNEAVEAAFPGTSWRAVDDSGGFQLQIARPGVDRWMDASELSDGTLRFFCLCAALLTPKPPPLLVFNEPETSLHPDLLEPLAELVLRTPPQTQILVVTHAQQLAERIAEHPDAKITRLVSFEGETRREGEDSGKRVWTFDG